MKQYTMAEGEAFKQEWQKAAALKKGVEDLQKTMKGRCLALLETVERYE